ncbi:MAG: type II CRISPR-associated endonuclease Cas1 [Alphaproteobacteria bacterium]|nr:type II CRISPR-associated endonuclease Cas1 [Alphaproteobacteria bacterium]
MLNNIIEISTDNKKLSVYRGFLRIEGNSDVLKDITFDAINSLIITARGVIYTNNLLQQLCERGIPLVILGKNFHPIGTLLSCIGNYKQTEVQLKQIENKKPLQKRIWQLIIQEKIKNQSRVLDSWNKKNELKCLHKKVLSGDSTNIEAYGARLYFKSLYGEDFIRNKDMEGINSFLNYGYAIIRAALARYVVASGLNPSFGVEHHNKLNPFCLVDDLIEPFRPIVDNTVYAIFQENNVSELTTEYKAKLSNLLTEEFYNGEGFSPLYVILQQIVRDLVKIYESKNVNFNFNSHLIKEDLF